jgi:hypothetical protein
MNDQVIGTPRVRASRLVVVGIATVCLFVAGILIIPFMPWMPVPGLDASWCYAFNEAVGRHMVFGRDLVFTFGPLASVYTTMYGPATDTIMLAGSSTIALGICATVWTMVWDRRKWLLVALPFVVALSYFRDPIFMILPVLVLVAAWGRKNAIAICIGAAAVGVLPLIKGSLTALSAVEIALACVVMILQGRWRVAVAVAMLPCILLAGTWIACTQPLGALPDYLRMQGPIIAGYTEAMSSVGPRSALTAYLACSAAILLIFFSRIARKPFPQNMVVFAGLAIFAAISFKAGFVRQDVHPRIAASALLFLAFCVCSVISGRLSVLVVVIAVFGFSAVEKSTEPFGLEDAYSRIHKSILGHFNGLMMRLSDPGYLGFAFAEAKLKIRAHTPMPEVSGSSDVYPTEISILLANDMSWSPRPVLQSYSAYLPVLDDLNAKHLEGSAAPRNVFLSVEPIDGRMPTIEDAHSWPILLTRYKVEKEMGDRLWLVRGERGSYSLGKEATVSSTLNVNQPIPIPVEGPVWMSVDIHKTALGKLLSAAYKLPPVTMELKISDGMIVYRRIVPEMAVGGFILSPYIATTQDFVAVQQGKGRRVVAVRILCPSHHGWDSAITLAFRPLTLSGY